jgi:hypothetical protein
VQAALEARRMATGASTGSKPISSRILRGDEAVKMNSAIRTLCGALAVLSVVAASHPASAASVTINDSAGTASQNVVGTTPSITVLGNTIACNINFPSLPLQASH